MPPFAFYPPVRTFGYHFTLPAAEPAVPIDVQAEPAPMPEAALPRWLRETNVEQKARAGRFIGFGDEQFSRQKFHAALGRYKTAVEVAPDVPEAHFRLAFAQTALGQYQNAAKTFRRGLQVRSDWRDSPFRLDQLYRDAQLTKIEHIENLAKAVEANPFDAEVLLVLGMELYFDGHPERAAVVFTRAAQLGANDEQLLNGFLPLPKPADAADPPAADGKLVF